MRGFNVFHKRLMKSALPGHYLRSNRFAIRHVEPSQGARCRFLFLNEEHDIPLLLVGIPSITPGILRHKQNLLRNQRVTRTSPTESAQGFVSTTPTTTIDTRIAKVKTLNGRNKIAGLSWDIWEQHTQLKTEMSKASPELVPGIADAFRPPF
jgi:hypothetical protein